MAKRLLQALSGMGGIYSGDQMLRETQYQLSVWAKFDAPGGKRRPSGSRRHRRDTSDRGMGEAVVLAGAEALTLQLAGWPPSAVHASRYRRPHCRSRRRCSPHNAWLDDPVLLRLSSRMSASTCRCSWRRSLRPPFSSSVRTGVRASRTIPAPTGCDGVPSSMPPVPEPHPRRRASFDSSAAAVR